MTLNLYTEGRILDYWSPFQYSRNDPKVGCLTVGKFANWLGPFAVQDKPRVVCSTRHTCCNSGLTVLMLAPPWVTSPTQSKTYTQIFQLSPIQPPNPKSHHSKSVHFLKFKCIHTFFWFRVLLQPDPIRYSDPIWIHSNFALWIFLS